MKPKSEVDDRDGRYQFFREEFKQAFDYELLRTMDRTRKGIKLGLKDAELTGFIKGLEFARAMAEIIIGETYVKVQNGTTKERI